MFDAWNCFKLITMHETRSTMSVPATGFTRNCSLAIDLGQVCHRRRRCSWRHSRTPHSTQRSSILIFTWKKGHRIKQGAAHATTVYSRGTKSTTVSIFQHR